MDLPAEIVVLCREISDELSLIARSWEFHFGRSKDGSEALHMARHLWEQTEPIGTKLQALESAMRELLGERIGVTPATDKTGQ
ncbi:hypothetical protein LJR029_003294 [Caballeronia sp. LjRoot29]|uniref:hypothetical protein n=1 Tax=Caballeronia sp. LjRoot29 TaxID=3342315 RepID=UPI003ECF9CA3